MTDGTGPRRGAGADPVGLCANCRHVRRVKTERGSVFYRCALAAGDPRFPKYPPLPVIQCSGYEADRDGAPTT
ncbi:MAG TPA: hypothetical protein VIJ73_16600 [Methylomirabilota bacterium]